VELGGGPVELGGARFTNLILNNNNNKADANPFELYEL
jgi:hypothetical protein